MRGVVGQPGNRKERMMDERKIGAQFRGLLDEAGVKSRRAEDGEWIAPGKRGLIAAHDGVLLAWALIYPGDKTPGAAYKNAAKRDPLLALETEGDDEAVFLFRPEDLAHVARRWCKCRFRKRLSEETRAMLAKRMAGMRAASRKPAQERTLSAALASDGGESSGSGVADPNDPRSIRGSLRGGDKKPC